MRQLKAKRRRGGFTMVELLIVITIIAILMALSMGAIFKALARANEVRNRHEIGLLDTAVTTFTTEWGPSYIPSRIKLSETCNYPDRGTPGTLDADSVAFLNAMFKRIDLSKGKQIDWNGDGNIGGDWVLEGQECLVYFLGGVPSATDPPACTGFSTVVTNPCKPGGERKNSLYDFNNKRLRRSPKNQGFLVYLDTYNQQPYAYFSPGKSNYNAGDCASLGVGPYYENISSNVFLKPNHCQIISAGPDGKFGPGGIPWPIVPAPFGKTNPVVDDQANFAERTLGKP